MTEQAAIDCDSLTDSNLWQWCRRCGNDRGRFVNDRCWCWCWLDAAARLRNRAVRFVNDDWQRTMDIDLNAVFLGCRAALPVIAKHAPGSIINISSIAGLIASNNFVAYNTAKAGVWMLTKSVALQAEFFSR